jgi:hypothetical protein
MMKIRQRKLMFALLALLLVFAGCKGESPTAPNPTPGGGGTTPPGGGVTPPVGATIVLTVVNPTPLVGSTATITATVTLNGNPVVDGTAVEFATDFGALSLTDPTVVSLIKTTVKGVASVTLTSASAGTANVTAVVNNVSKQTQIKFQTTPTIPTPVNTNPTITSITPTQGRPAGGELVSIVGTNFRAPVRVIFDFGGGVTKDAFVTSVAPTQIVVTTPPIDVGTGQQKQATITVIDEAGTANEVKVTSAANVFTFQADVLTPSITTISPTSGPIDGGTRVTIFGDGFQAPVQVFFGSQDAIVISVTFKQIIVMSPTARDTAPSGSGAVTGPVDIKIINIASNKSVTSASAFRYTPKMQITNISPGQGTAFGGTTVRIDGVGFTDPVSVVIATIPARTISVSGTEILAVTSPTPSPCAPPTGPVSAVNVDNGDGASGPSYTYTPEIPLITGVSPGSITVGMGTTVTVTKPGVGIDGTATIRFKLGTAATLFPNPTTISDPRGPISFTLTVPANFQLPTAACTIGTLTGTRQVPTTFDVIFQNVTTGCTDTALQALTINPTSAACVLSAPAPAITVNPGTLCPPNAFPSTTVGMPTNQQIIVTNSGGATASPLIVTTNIAGGNAAGDFNVNPSSLSVAGGQSLPMTVTFTPSAVGVRTSTLTLFTNDPGRPTVSICLQGTGM